MGGSVRTINLTLSLVPGTEPYWKGRTYAQSISHIVPFLQGMLTFKFYGYTPAGWLTVTLFGRGAAGTGFSIAGEGYLNFGLPGTFFHMIMIGALFRWIYVRFASMVSPGRSLLFFVSFGIFLISVRGDTNLIFAPLAHIVIISWLLKVLFGEKVYIDGHTTYALPDTNLLEET